MKRRNSYFHFIARILVVFALSPLTPPFANARAAAQGTVRPGLSSYGVDPTPFFRTSSSASGDALLLDAQSATRLPDGSVVVGDNGARNVKWYAPDGRFVRSFGRDGDGPGEFRIAHVVGTCGTEDVQVFDGANQRLTTISRQGKLVSARLFMTDRGDAAAPYMIRCGASKRFGVLGWPRGALPASDDAFRAEVAVRIQNLDGSNVINVGTVPGGERQRFGSSVGPRPLGKRTYVAVGQDRIYIGTGESEIRAVSLLGRALPALQLPFRARKITAREVEGYVNWLVGINSHLAPDVVSRTYGKLKYPDYTPVHGDVLVDPLENVWVEQYRLPFEPSSRWIVFSKGAQIVAEVRLPDGLRMLEVGVDYILGTWTDDDGTAHVRMHRLRRSS